MALQAGRGLCDGCGDGWRCGLRLESCASVDGAVSCAWIMESDRTVIVATVAGNRPNTGGAVCDRVVVALATDLGIPAGEPDRLPR